MKKQWVVLVILAGALALCPTVEGRKDQREAPGGGQGEGILSRTLDLLCPRGKY